MNSQISDTLEMLAFNLKLVSKKVNKNILISAGSLEDKYRLLPSLSNLVNIKISIYATHRTSVFLTENNIENSNIYKIAEHTEPNILSFLNEDRFDLIINLLSGDADYDETSDSKLIRKLSIENGIPLITDIDVAIMTLDNMSRNEKTGIYKYKLSDTTEPWNMEKNFFHMVDKLGGLACHHAHFDKAYLISMDNLKLSHVDMQKKWTLYRYLKENYTHDDLVERMSRGVEKMIGQGVVYCKTFVDADAIVKLLPIHAALEVKKKYDGRIRLEIGVQPLEGVLNPDSRKLFTKACEMADFIGGLPSKDRPQPEKHLDYVMGLARSMGKRLEVHVDQENNPYENETELLAVKTMEYGLHGRVVGIHAISLSAKHGNEQDRIIEKVKDAGLGIALCPSAAVSMRQLTEISTPTHNSIGPLVKFLDAGIPVGLGVDNVHDLFMPMVDGNIWTECRILMEATRFYDLEKIAEIACNKHVVFVG